MPDCCRNGFRWEGEPTGREETIGDVEVYITGENKDGAIVFCHDGFGWKWNNNRLLADHFAKEVGVTVYIPDFYHNDAVPPEVFDEGAKPFDWPTWLSKNSVDVCMPEILTFARHIRSQYSKVAAVGHCWGGKAALRLGGKEFPGLVDCITFGHPSFITAEELKSVAVPIQIIAPEHDVVYTAELKRVSNEEIPKLGVDYDYQHFPGMNHGFATKCNMSNINEKRALERAKNAMVYWFTNYLK